MEVNYPLISIITPCLNRVQFISQAVESVLYQEYPNVEHIIVDGGSTDGTIEVLQRYPHLRVISEPDKGVYDAFNKGVRLSQGEIIGFLNSDDLYELGIFREVAKCFLENPQIDAVWGMAVTFEEDKLGKRKVLKVWDHFKEDKLLVENVTLSPPLTNAHFFHRRVFIYFGFFNLEYQIAADREFFIRLALGNVRSKSLKRITYHYRSHADSLTIGSNDYNLLDVRIKEYLVLSENYLNKISIPLKISYVFKRWHTRITVTAAWHYLRHRKLIEGLICVRKGIKYDFQWPVIFAWQIIRRILSKFVQLISYFKVKVED